MSASQPNESTRQERPVMDVRRPSVHDLGGLDMAAVQARLQHEFAVRAQQDPHKNPLPTAEELQGDFDALIEARALKLLESRSRSGSFSASRSASRRSSFNANHPREDYPSAFASSPSSESPPSAPPLRAPHLQHLPSGLSMTSAHPASSHSPLSESTILEDPHNTGSALGGESALSSGMNTPITEDGSGIGSGTRSQIGSRRNSTTQRALSRRPSMKKNVNSYEVR